MLGETGTFVEKSILGLNNKSRPIKGKRKGFGWVTISKEAQIRKNYILTVYKNMIRRCYQKDNREYKNYGGRGIKVDENWIGWGDGYRRFLIWAIKSGCKQGLTIDRIDNEKSYTPDNCCFVSMADNVRYRRNTVITMTLAKELRKQFLEEHEKTGISKNKFTVLMAKQLNIAHPTLQACMYNITWKE